MKSRQKLANLRLDSEYHALVEECKAIITERIFNARVEKILAYGQIGEALVSNSLYQKWGTGNLEFLRMVSRDTQISYSELCRAIQFYQKFGITSVEDSGWNRFKEGKNISWNKIKIYYLPSSRKECQHEPVEVSIVKCAKCGKILRDEKAEAQV